VNLEEHRAIWRFDEAMEALAPLVPWREPIRLTLLEPPCHRWGCRLCIARVGLKGVDVPMQFGSEHACRTHIAAMHTPPPEPYA